MADRITAAQFIRKWQPVQLPERAASQEHFLDLCHLLGQPTPAEQDAIGDEYTFEKGVSVTGAASTGSKGERGFADVWWRGKFGWEYKRKDKYKSLEEAYRQLCQYREALENPPLLIVSDIARIQIHTNFTGTRKEIHEIRLPDIAHPDSLDKLRRVFTDPLSFKPTLTTYHLTESAAAEFAKIADQLRQRNHDPHTAAHFLMKCMFCLFAEDVKLLPDGLFKKLLERGVRDPDDLAPRLNELFTAMRAGGHFGADDIPHFNGGLFDDAPALPLRSADIKAVLIAADFDWGAVEPSIFGTLFERSLDPSKRSQIGAHYTSREDIMLIVEPVVMAPLRREWAQVKAEVEKQLSKRRGAVEKSARTRADKAIAMALDGFLNRLASLRILDPACGSGNFLYVAIQELLALEKEVIVFASRPEIATPFFPRIRPTQLHGIEINPYAAELAQVVIWIGYLQWMRDNGFLDSVRRPILEPLQTIECRDAILDFAPEPRPSGRADDDLEPRPSGRAESPRDVNVAAPDPCSATWPQADFIIGNPPFLGSKLFRASGLEDAYVEAMYAAYDLPKTSDLCCYWFEQARRVIGAAAFTPRGDSDGAAAFRPRGEPERRERRGSVRVGLLATQGIRGGDNRTVLERIKQTGDIFLAWSDRDWILDGAAVHVSMVGFDGGVEQTRYLNSQPVANINPNLTADADTTTARPLSENTPIAWSIGTQKGGAFEFDHTTARNLLTFPNPNGRPSSDVLRPWRNASDLTGRLRGLWIVDFGPAMSEDKAARYERPFEYVRSHVKPDRDLNRRDSYRLKWWIHQEPRNELRPVLESPQVLLTPRIAKHRLWIRTDSTILPDCALVVFARSDDYFFGVLHSAIHELWALRMGTQLEDRPRYTPTTCFETFPLPWPPGAEPRPSGRAGDASEPRRSRRAELPRDVNVAAPSPRDVNVAAPSPRDVNVAAPSPRDVNVAAPSPRDVNVAAPSPRDVNVAAPNPRDVNVAAPDLAFGATYLLTWTTYGTWLPGDERGFVSRIPEGTGGHAIHNIPGEPYDADDERLHRAAKARMTGPPTHLDSRAAEICAAAFREVANQHGIGIHAAAIMATHVHLVVTTADAEPSRLLNLLKGVSSRRLGQAFGRRSAGAWWTRGGSCRSLRDDRAIRAATTYVREQPSPFIVFNHAPEPRPSGRAGDAPEPRPSGRAEHPRDVNVAAQEASAFQRISAAAQELNDQRERWLNPPEWIEDWGRLIDARDKFEDVPAEARPLLRHSAIMAEAAHDPRFKKRTLTHLYNERPTWLKLAHEKLDRAVLAAYAAVDPAGGWSEDWSAVWTDTGAGQPLPDDHALVTQRKEIDQRVLANLLRLNLARAAAQ